MTKYLTVSVALAIALVALQSGANAHGRRADRVAARHARGMSWHADYYNTVRGVPISLVVPPTAHMQTNWGWGVSQDTVTPIYHQFRRPYPGEIQVGGFQRNSTPRQPSHSSQFGVYYIRAPY